MDFSACLPYYERLIVAVRSRTGRFPIKFVDGRYAPATNTSPSLYRGGLRFLLEATSGRELDMPVVPRPAQLPHRSRFVPPQATQVRDVKRWPTLAATMPVP
jgi:hypothetical protein